MSKYIPKIVGEKVYLSSVNRSALFTMLSLI